ncbi:Ig-like domain-containing protein [Variovorax paradoxus]|uniref:Ig-like domain-containing protein n=1 Tax=Variovorax paradoxus TaxID=34073 RepID=UPI003D65E5DB
MTTQRLAPRGVAATVAFAMLVQTVSVGAFAADLTIDDGVVVKYGADAQLVVRDRISTGKGITFTSQKDDGIAGQTGTGPQAPAAGDWRGVRIEKSASSFGALTLNDLAIRYAGGSTATDPGAALTVRGWSPTLQYLQLTDSSIGLRLLGASPSVTGASFLRNATGIEAEDNSAPIIDSTQFAGSSTLAVSNKSPVTVIQAANNWWGHPSGPKELTANPQGQGDNVSTGVNFAGFLTAAPLINCSLRLASAAPFVEQREVLLDLSCVNATEYRIAEDGGFANVAFSALANGRGQVPFVLSEGEGRKNISVQYRNASGTVVTSALSGGVLLDSQAPIVVLVSPAAGSVVNQPITVEATASDASGIAKVQFYLDDQPAATRTSTPYSYTWNVDASSDGAHVLKAVATDLAGRTGEQSVGVTVSRTPQAPDTEGPVVANAKLDAAALTNGTIVARDGVATVDVTDRSGVARVELLLDGQVTATAAAAGGGRYSAALSIAGVPNGAHTLAWRALDSLNNATTAAYQVTVTHAAPNAPVITSPQSGLTTRTAALPVSGTAAAGSSVQLLVNGQPSGPLLTTSNGTFGGTVTLAAGLNQVQAQASNAHGQSAPSTAVNVTLNATVPTAPTGLSAVALTDGKVRLVWTRSTDPNATGYDIYRSRTPFTDIGAGFKANASPVSGTTYEDMPSPDGTWFYRMVAVNSAATPSVPTDQVQVTVDGTAPKAISVVYQPLGKVDAATGRIGQGKVNVQLSVSEELQTAPYLAVVPAGGSPIVIELTRANATSYTGAFLIDANTPSGTANALFSARDIVGNRGTEVASGATLKIDTAGPALSSITLNPGAPIKAGASTTVQATFIFSKAPKAGATPQIKYQLSGAGRQPTSIAGLSAVDATTWKASFILPSDAGLAASEILSFSSQAQDDLDNISTRVSAANRFQVYQGNLPPAGAPLLLTGKAMPGGKASLTWQAVDEAFAYQVYRKGPSDSALVALARSSGATYVDQTPADARYTYAVASIRKSNGEETVSSQSATVEVVTIADAPGAPQNLTLLLTGQGIKASWQAPVASTVDYYNLYRASGTSITSVTGLTPIKTRVKGTVTYDPQPSPSQGAYAVTAVDAAGNESAVSNSGYLNASLLPVVNLRVEQIGNALPALSWQAPNGSLSGYNVYVGPDATRVKLTPNPIAATAFSDSGFSGGERRYTVASVDASGQEIGRSLSLPSVSTQIVSGLPIKRGVMNKVQAQVVNTSATAVSNARVVIRLPINRDATQFADHKSEPFELGSNQTQLVTVVVGGYADLPGQAQAQVGIESSPNEGETVKIARNQTLDVGDSALVVGISTGEFTRGATGKVRLTIENTSEVEVEFLTATAGGNDPSSELRFKILDTDGNVLATQPYKQAVGANVVTLTNGQTVARIPAGASYTSDQFDLAVPGSSPNSIRVKLEVDKMRYRSGQDDQVVIAGRGSEKAVSLVDTAYVGEVTNVTPLTSFGDQDIVITGRALARGSNQALPGTRLKLVFNQQGFERVFSVLTDPSGAFTYTFQPTATDAGLYKVSAIHPDLTDRPEQRSFTINRVTYGPTPFKVDVPRNYSYPVPFIARSGAGTTATNMRFVLEASAQPTGQLPTGISLQLPAPASIGERSQVNIPVVFSATNEALASGSIILSVYSDERPQGAGAPIGLVRINYALSEAKAYLVSLPTVIETGMSQGANQIESVTVQNKGTQDALALAFTLAKPDGSAVPSWVNISSSGDGNLAVGEKRTIDIAFKPPAGLQEGVYEFRLNVQGTNVPAQSLNIYASVTQSGKGSALFRASDIYTATLDKQGQLIPGLAGANVTLQNEDVASVSYQLTTDNLGEAYFQGIPAGRYTYRARANNHQEVAGRLQIKPGITLTQPIFLNYNLITVEWSVREVTVEDQYDVIIDATFETDVPAAVVVMQPSSVNLPKMNPGDVFYGELSLTNHGLIRADAVKQQLPQSDAFFRYEFLVQVPTDLQAKQRVTIPYRVIALQSLDTPANAGNASGGGCYNYSNTTRVSYDYTCKNGMESDGSTSTSWFNNSRSTCPAPGTGGGSGGSSGGSGSWGSGGFGGIGGGSTSIPLPGKKCMAVPGGKTQCS